MSIINQGQVFEQGNAINGASSTIPFSASSPNWNRLRSMALRAHEDQADPEITTVSQFVVRQLHVSAKPISENLLLKKITKAKIMMHMYPNISSLVVKMTVEGIIERSDKGVVLTKRMKALIEEVKSV